MGILYPKRYASGHMPRTSSTLRLFAGLLCLSWIIPQAALAAPSEALVSSAQLVKKNDSSSVYFVNNGKRYAFPNEEVYFSWYSDFHSVTTLSDQELARLPLAGNVTYKPGSHLLKVQTDPSVYAVSRYGVLRKVNEQQAAEVYGQAWNANVRDIEDTFFSNYVVGPEVSEQSPYHLSSESSISSISQNIRPQDFVPPIAPALLSVGVSTPRAVVDQRVIVFANVVNNARPLARLTIFEGETPLSVCYATSVCQGTYTATQSKNSVSFRASAVDDHGATIDLTPGYGATLEVLTSRSDIQISASPAAISSGDRVQFTSDASRLNGITNHKVFLIAPGEPNPILWKDCGADPVCHGDTPIYRTSQLFSTVIAENQTFQSAAATVTVVRGTAPKPALAIASRPSSNQAVLTLNAPVGETIGFSAIVAGTHSDDDALALCDQALCEATVQFSTPQTFTAFTDVGGTLEASNSVNVTP